MIHEEAVCLYSTEDEIDMIGKMFSIYHGTAVDTSLLIDHLTSYVFSAANDTPVEQHLVMGISLGVSDEKLKRRV